MPALFCEYQFSSARAMEYIDFACVDNTDFALVTEELSAGDHAPPVHGRIALVRRALRQTFGLAAVRTHVLPLRRHAGTATGDLEGRENTQRYTDLRAETLPGREYSKCRHTDEMQG
ncbi:MAG TPA: hypothetical protein VLN59_06130, partial [Burkholderiales bacterium]|nr:hypothetical protein [Burkholderiales bacterium]